MFNVVRALYLQSISSRYANTTPLQPGMVVSNEPGYYKSGEGGFGVRIENLLEIVDSGISNGALGRRYSVSIESYIAFNLLVAVGYTTFAFFITLCF